MFSIGWQMSTAMMSALSGYQTSDGLRRTGTARLTTWLAQRKARNASATATKATQAANAQHTTVRGQSLAATMVAGLAKEMMTLDTEIGATETMIEDRFRRHRHAEIILSMPGFGVVPGAEFLAATGDDMSTFDSVDRLAGMSGLAPVPPDSGRISANLKRPRRYDRRLLRACYLSAQIAIHTDAASRTYYDRKRSEGKTHTQAAPAVARPRPNILWAMLRDHRAYQPTAPNAAAA
ncbi:IS110 family transposase [Mycobacterium kansasii]|nr:IS110 family transposase [Mycobacterium kansasii]